MDIVQRFLKYVAFESMSDENSSSVPSTPTQKILGAALAEEMREMGIADAYMDEYGYVYGTIPGTLEDGKAAILVVLREERIIG